MNESTAKILCVDDEPSILAALKRLLASDFTFLAATSGEEALEILRQNPDVAIVVSDHRMPGMTGLQLLTEAKSIAPDAVRAVLSGQIDLGDMAEAIHAAQIHRFFLKPWENDYLKVQMLEALSVHRLLKEKAELERLSITDPVTHLSNHRHFHDRMRIEVERSIRHSRPVSLVMIDIDHFKRFNDQFGHPAGDALLRAVAHRLTDLVRSIDTVSRYGGEEFAVILPDTGPETALVVAERVRKSFEEKPFPGPNGRPAFVTISLGVAAAPTHATDSTDLISLADRALYQAKRQGRNQTVGAQSSTPVS